MIKDLPGIVVRDLIVFDLARMVRKSNTMSVQSLSKLTGQVCNDVRITARVYGYVKANRSRPGPEL